MSKYLRLRETINHKAILGDGRLCFMFLPQQWYAVGTASHCYH
ncbi:MAG: hypothetical protein ACFC03_00500 [Candidatus Malihini olakiniferum]